MKIIATRKIPLTQAQYIAEKGIRSAFGEIIYSADGMNGIIIINPKAADERIYGWENLGGYRIQHYRIEGLDMRATLRAAGYVPGYSYMVESIIPCDDAARYRALPPEEEIDVAHWRAKLSGVEASPAAILGAKGGRAKSEAKAAAARANGRKGGRPRKERGDA